MFAFPKYNYSWVNGTADAKLRTELNLYIPD